MPTEHIDPDLGYRLKDALAKTPEIEAAFEAQYRIPIHTSALLSQDEAVGSAASAFNTASASVVSAVDHLRTWHQIVATMRDFPLPTFSHYTLARGAYEPALLTLWLLDPNVDSSTRIGRGYAAQLKSLKDMQKFQKSAGMTGDSANALTLQKRLIKEARAAGFTDNLKAGTERLRKDVPDMVDLFNMYDRKSTRGMSEWLYRYLSGYAHSREWAVLRGARETELRQIDTGLHEVKADLKVLCFLANRTVSIVSRAINSYIRYRTHPVGDGQS